MQAKEKRMRTDMRDLTVGNVALKTIGFAVPIIITNLLQALYNIADMAIVGHFIGSAGMSAVNIGGQVTMIILVFCQGVSNGGGILVSNLFGAKKKELIPKVVGTMLSFFFLLALFFIVLVLALGVPILKGLDTPPEAFAGTKTYLFICIAGTVFIYFYNVLAAVLRGIGESFRPMIFVAITVALNIGLDALFVGPMHMGVAGAALATIVSQFISMCMAIWYVRKLGLFDFRLPSFKIDREFLKVTLKIGIPQGLQFALTNISFLLIMGFINPYGVAASAATGAVTKIGTFAVLPAQALMTGLITMTAQNIPVKQYQRILKSMFVSMGISLLFTGFIFLLAHLIPEAMLGIFTTDPEVIAIGSEYLKILTISYMIESLMFCLYGIITGGGHTYYVFGCAILSAFIIRFTFSWIFSSFTSLGLMGIGWAYVLAPACSGLAALIFILTGKWKKNRVKV
ncbi:MAG: MATE family efflux transporter [Lachnospiraceae bacterium]|nr:MATE family efflux transporter [Lachnospiraceae bacterium]